MNLAQCIDIKFWHTISTKTGENITIEQILHNLWQQIAFWINHQDTKKAENILNDIEKILGGNINTYNLAKMNIAIQHQSAVYAQCLLQTLNKNHILTQALNGLAKSIENIYPHSNEYLSILYTLYRIDPNNQDTILALGNYFISSKEYDKAKEFFDTLEKLNPNHQYLHKNRGLLYECQKEYKCALLCFCKYKNLVESQNNPGELQYVYGKIVEYAQMLDKLYLALHYCKKLTKNTTSLFQLANCYWRLENFEKAKEYCKQALEKTQNQDENIRTTISFSYDILKIRLGELNIANLTTNLYSYHSIMNLWGLYNINQNMDDNNGFKKSFHMIIKNSYKHHNNINCNNKLPTILYKYYGCIKRALESIKQENLYLSDPNKFNDPFDPPIKRADKYEDFKNLLGNIQIGCLSENWNDVLMWSHYAGSHKGICIGYDVSNIFNNKFDTNNTILKKCIYLDNLSMYDFFIQPDIVNAKDLEPFKDNVFNQPSFLDMYSIKHKNWSYEKEWRIITHNIDNNKIMLPIKEVYFGLNMCEEYKECITIFIQKHKSHIKLYNIINDKATKQKPLYILQRKDHQ
ncbi:DUF2971 domain-containing protein [uncultured Helicobacter sp.]|uniref:DUF2971 domain-containing protein n=1 Tax=uncultured Helicobacter sp. TaxID=175537 RepID=UPI00374E64B5